MSYPGSLPPPSTTFLPPLPPGSGQNGSLLSSSSSAPLHPSSGSTLTQSTLTAPGSAEVGGQTGRGKARGRGRGRGRGRARGSKRNWSRPARGDEDDDEEDNGGPEGEEDNADIGDGSSSLVTIRRRAKPPDSTPAGVGVAAGSPATDAAGQLGGQESQQPELTTKSGRRVQKPNTFVPSSAPAWTRPKKKKPLLLAPDSTTSHDPGTGAPSAGPDKEATPHAQSGIHSAAPSESIHPACVSCRSDHSDPGDELVLCDICDAAYHQTCHRPRIPDAVLNDPDSKWYCITCTTQGAQAAPVLASSDIIWDEYLPASRIPPSTRQAYLDDLPRAYLKKIVEMLLERYPDARVFPKDVEAQVASAAAATAAEVSQLGKRKRDGDEGDHASFKTARLDQSGSTLRTAPNRLDLDPALAAQPGIDDTDGTLPSYEEMIVQALNYIDDPHGSLPRLIFEWMNDAYPLVETFRASASQALQKASKRGRLHKEGNLYKVNRSFDEAEDAKRGKSSRRPQRDPSRVETGFTPSVKPRLAYATPEEVIAAARGDLSVSREMHSLRNPASSPPAAGGITRLQQPIYAQQQHGNASPAAGSAPHFAFGSRSMGTGATVGPQYQHAASPNLPPLPSRIYDSSTGYPALKPILPAGMPHSQRYPTIPYAPSDAPRSRGYEEIPPYAREDISEGDMTQRAIHPSQSPQHFVPSPYPQPTHSHPHSRNSSLSISQGPPSVTGSRGSTSSFYGSLPAQGSARLLDGYAPPDHLTRSAPIANTPTADAGHWRRPSGHQSPFPPYDPSRGQHPQYPPQQQQQQYVHMQSSAGQPMYQQPHLYRVPEDMKPRQLVKSEMGSYSEMALPSLAGGSSPLRYSSGSGSFDNSNASALPHPPAQAGYQFQTVAPTSVPVPSPVLLQQQQQHHGTNLPGLAQITNLPSPVPYGAGNHPYAYQQPPTSSQLQQSQQYQVYTQASGQEQPQMHMHQVEYQQHQPPPGQQGHNSDIIYRHPPHQEPVYHGESSRSSSIHHVPTNS